MSFPNNQQISFSVFINSTPEKVWYTLTDIDEMLQWMGEELQLQIATTWEQGTPVRITGFHHEHFENTGIVLECNPPHVLTYTHLSSVSQLPDAPENYCIQTFTLEPKGGGTQLHLLIKQFPTESIFRHLQLYWGVTLRMIKERLETIDSSWTGDVRR